MKANFRKTVLAAASVCFLGAAAVTAQAASYPVTAAQRAAADQAAKDGIAVAELSPDAPASYTVKRGDTLWGISGKFLRSPWKWPALWGMNLSEVSNPHKIYPAEVLHLEVINGKARLTRGSKAGQSANEIRLSPSIRIEEQFSAISTIPFDQIKHFLTRPMLVDDAAFASSGMVMGAEEGRINAGTGDKVYAKNLPGEVKPGSKYAIYRAGRIIVDPDTRVPLGREAVYLGEAEVARPSQGDDLTALKVSSSVQEIGRNDRLLSIPSDTTFQYVPRAPEQAIDAKVVMLHDGRSDASLLSGKRSSRAFETEGGPLSIVVLNRGESHGLAAGHVLQLSRKAHKSIERSSAGFRNGDRVLDAVQYPSEAFGNVMVFKVFGSIAYGIVLEASAPVAPGDLVESAKAGQP